ncbi:MAG: AI-2E family transporter [Candidatus Cloacimonadales bacterium]
MLKKNSKLIFNIFVLLLFGVAAVFYWNILASLLAGIVFAFILNPAVSYIESYGVSRIISIVAVYSIIILTIFITMIFVIPKVITQGESIFSFINQSEAVQNVMGSTPKVDKNTIQVKTNPIINIYMNYDKKQERFVIDGSEQIINKPKEEIIELQEADTANIAPLTHSDSLKNGSLEKFMEIPILAQVIDYVNFIDDKLTFVDITDEFKKVVEGLKEEIVQVPMIVISNVKKIASTFAFVFMIPLISFFILKDKNLFSKMFNRFIPNRFFELYITITHKISELVSSFLRALLIEIFIVAVLTAIVLTIIGVNYSILIGLLAGFANMVPYFGPFFGVVFAIGSVILTGQDISMIFYVIFGMWGVQIIDNNIVYPIVIGKSTNIHPLYVFLTVVAGGTMFGVLGMIISVPVVYIVTEISKEMYSSLKKYDII